jgi:hypothetical protein
MVRLAANDSPFLIRRNTDRASLAPDSELNTYSFNLCGLHCFSKVLFVNASLFLEAQDDRGCVIRLISAPIHRAGQWLSRTKTRHIDGPGLLFRHLPIRFFLLPAFGFSLGRGQGFQSLSFLD